MASQNNEIPPLNSIFSRYGTATPYLALFNSDGEPIMNQLTEIPLGEYITQFSYKYDEQKENQARLTFEVGDPDIVDQVDLQEGSTILLQWGYIFNNGSHISGPIKSIKVKDFNSTFDSTGVHVSLVCIDGAVSLRHIPPCAPCAEEDKAEMGFMKFLDNGCMMNVAVIIEEFNSNTPN